MNVTQLFLYALIIVLIYLIYTYVIKGSSNKLTGVLTAGAPYVVSEDTIKSINKGQNIFNYTTSVWIYVDNWDVTPNLKKPILTIKNALDIYLGSIDNNLSVDIYPLPALPALQDASNGYSNMNPLTPSPIEGLTPMNITSKKRSKENMTNLEGSPFEEFYGKVSRTANVKNEGKNKEGFDTEKPKQKEKANVKSYGTLKEGLETNPISNLHKFTSVVPSIPLQSWTNITVSIHDKSIDIYINGKLIQSNIFPFVSSPVSNSITLTPSPGFIGWTSNLQYYPYNLTPSQINNIYNHGYRGSAEGILSLLGKYSMKVVFVDNTQQP
jgi:hypothetical protein